MTTALIVGQPNCGKTELFNALTDSHAPVGNWSGVTVAVESATFCIQETSITIQDTPGIYALMDKPESEDEKITHAILTQTTPDLLINVIDVANLERQLFLTSELLELKIPLVVVLNMHHAEGALPKLDALSVALGCKVLLFEKNTDSKNLHQSLLSELKNPTPPTPPILPLPHNVHTMQDADLHIADARYTFCHKVANLAQVQQTKSQDKLTAQLDAIFLHRYLGLPLFFFMMYSLFFFAVHVGGIVQTFFDNTSTVLFIETPSLILQKLNTPAWLSDIFCNGLGRGLTTTISFIPILATMYFGLSFLEGSGYMARAAFVMDRLMRLIGLPGKAFVPLIIGFGCNVPAILATRTLENKRERMLTILMAPFMSCSARLTIYSVFVSAFFKENGQNIIFSLYLLGIGAAILTGIMFKKLFFAQELAPLTLELPNYQSPNFKRLSSMSFIRLSRFLKRAALFIIPVCISLSVLNMLPSLNAKAPNLLAYLGQMLTPIFTPMGLTTDNWPATVGLFTGILAKEVVIGSLNTLYQQAAHLNFASPVSNIMQQYFPSFASVYAYLVFILLYMPCISTMSAIKQESSAKLMWIAIIWSFGIAYILAILIYQLISFATHPLTSSKWIIGLFLLAASFILCLRRFPQITGDLHAV
ncbi:MAG: ferrous iron transport protein B [Legionellales bacterium RIFCSPHIGHO2_12_FULL_37_14]|nr:MAG: ferrous iron transport protein B [Legionellales bacterium RIFCSPHIGHO2_12_FULL_37_14]